MPFEPKSPEECDIDRAIERATEVAYCPKNPAQELNCRVETCPCCAGLGVAARCQSCNGTGAIYVRTLREAQLAHSSQFERCEVCKGRGWWPISSDLFDRLGFSPRKPVRHAG
jgi:DnaJ-class molecular chaperone